MKHFFKFLKQSKIWRKVKAFTLIEIMVSLIAISAISAAFVPVMTKKISGKAANLTSRVNLTQSCEMFSNPSEGGTNDSSCGKCSFCDVAKSNQYCIKCSCNCPNGQFKVIKNCTCALCSTIDTNCTLCSTGAICKKCNVGYYLENNSCKQCESGYYCPDGINKKECEIGYYCPQGASSSTPCEAGSYTSSTKQSSCAICESGYYCPGGTDHKLCPAGSYTNTTGKSSCTTCESGYYCTGGSSHTKCSAGTYSTKTGATSSSTCSSCGSGYYCTGGSNRATCSSKTTNCTSCNASNGTCTGCKTGQKLNASNKCVSCAVSGCTRYSSGCNCSKCSSGYYLSSYSCKACESGYYCADGTKTSCSSKTSYCGTCNSTNGVCTSCRVGYKLSGSTCINPCSSGYFYVSEANACISKNSKSCTGSVTCVSSGNNCTNAKCCWGSYCNKAAAKEICSKAGDKLASMSTLKKAMTYYQSYINFSRSSFKSNCAKGDGRGDKGGPGYICYPNIVWGSDGVAAINSDGSVTSNGARPEGVAASVFCQE